MAVRIRPTTEGDIDALNANLSAADRDEIVAASGPDTRETIRLALSLSTHALAVEGERDELLCLMGCAPISMLDGRGAPWMLGTPELRGYRRTLARVARRYFSEVARAYPVLVNHVDARNTESIKLLRWLGCRFDPPAPFGKAGLPFMRFEWRGEG